MAPLTTLVVCVCVLLAGLLSLVAVRLAVALTGQFRRHGGGMRLAAGVGITVGLLAVGLTIGNLATRDNAFVWMIWGHALAPGAVAWWWLIGAPGIQMGFNDGVAWAHTFSKGHRFTLYQLRLSQDAPTSYHWGDQVREMSAGHMFSAFEIKAGRGAGV